MGRARIIADLVGFSTDSGVLNFGADKEITLTHDPDDGLILKHAATADDSFPELTFQTGDTDIAVNDLLGRINFQAPDEGAGTDAILVAGAIAAISEGDFSSSANATSLIFQTGASETATTKMTLSSGGNLDVTGDITGSTLNADGDTAAGDNAAIGFTSTEGLILTGQGSTNDVTIKNDADADVIEIPTGTVNVTMAGDASIGDDLLLLSDAAVLNFGADSEIKLTHVHNTGLLLTDSGGTPTLQFHDANESISSDGSKVIITSGGTAFSLPTADGSANQVLATNGSAVLSFADNSGGQLIQTVNTTRVDVVSGTTTMPFDDTIPQKTEGVEFLTVAITPTKNDNKLLISVHLQCQMTNNGQWSMALFQDDTADALAASSERDGASDLEIHSLKHFMTTGTTSETTFKIRSASSGAGTITMNSVAGSRKYGGVLSSSITVQEIEV